MPTFAKLSNLSKLSNPVDSTPYPCDHVSEYELYPHTVTVLCQQYEQCEQSKISDFAYIHTIGSYVTRPNSVQNASGHPSLNALSHWLSSLQV